MTRTARVVRFSGVSLMGVGVQLGALALLAHGAGLHYAAATPAAVVAAICHNFLWHRRWTWRDRRMHGSAIRQFMRFVAGNGLVSLVGNSVLMLVFAGTLGLDPLPANILSIAACALVNFHLADGLVFPPR